MPDAPIWKQADLKARDYAERMLFRMKQSRSDKVTGSAAPDRNAIDVSKR